MDGEERDSIWCPLGSKGRTQVEQQFAANLHMFSTSPTPEKWHFMHGDGEVTEDITQSKK